MIPVPIPKGAEYYDGQLMAFYKTNGCGWLFAYSGGEWIRSARRIKDLTPLNEVLNAAP